MGFRDTLDDIFEIGDKILIIGSVVAIPGGLITAGIGKYCGSGNTIGAGLISSAAGLAYIIMKLNSSLSDCGGPSDDPNDYMNIYQRHH